MDKSDVEKACGNLITLLNLVIVLVLLGAGATVFTVVSMDDWLSNNFALYSMIGSIVTSALTIAISASWSTVLKYIREDVREKEKAKSDTNKEP